MGDMGLEMVVNYLDDLLIHTVDMEDHLDNVEKVLQAHLGTGIRLKPSKMLFFQEKVNFLGFQVSKNGIRPIYAYICSISDIQAPKTGKEVASVLGFLAY